MDVRGAVRLVCEQRGPHSAQQQHPGYTRGRKCYVLIIFKINYYQIIVENINLWDNSYECRYTYSLYRSLLFYCQLYVCLLLTEILNIYLYIYNI